MGRGRAGEIEKQSGAFDEALEWVRDGRITEAGEESVTLDVEGTTREVSLAEVQRAQVQIEFKREG